MHSRIETVYDDQWFLVVADECHYLKTRTTSANKLFTQLNREATLFVAATPLSNHVRDVLGYLNIVWKRAWPFVYDPLDAIPSSPFYRDGAYQQLLSTGEVDGVSMARILGEGDDWAIPDVRLTAPSGGPVNSSSTWCAGGRPRTFCEPLTFRAVCYRLSV